MVNTIIGVVVSFVVSGLLGYLVGILKNEKIQNKALLNLLRNDLTRIFFEYKETKQIPDYIYENFTNELEAYESLDGDGFIHTMAKQMEDWEIIKTGILK